MQVFGGEVPVMQQERRSVETLGVDLRTRTKQFGREGEGEKEEV